MERVKKFFNIKTTYKFELNDLRAGIQILNVVLIMIFGLVVSWFGLTVAIIELVRDFLTDHRINAILMHFACIILNMYFLMLLYH